jgi:purine catabolism regulator
VLALEHPDTDGTGLSVVQHIATVIALRLAMLGQQREAWRREGAETFSEMMRAPMDGAQVSRRLGYHGFRESDELVVAIAGPLADDSEDDRVADVLSQADCPHLLLRIETELYILVPATAEAIDTLTVATTAPLGTSRPFRADTSLPLALREARSAVATAARTGVARVAYGDDPTVRWLTDNTLDLQALAQDVLGDVLEYDTHHAAELVQTVRTWLELDRETHRAAELLHVHPNTLLYRIRRFEEISGRTLSTTQGSTEVWLALRAMAHSDRPTLPAPSATRHPR